MYWRTQAIVKDESEHYLDKTDRTSFAAKLF